MYEGQLRDPEEVCLLGFVRKSVFATWEQVPLIKRVDGVANPDADYYCNKWGGSFVIELRPGRHVIEVGVTSGFTEASPVALSAVLKKGRLYSFRAVNAEGAENSIRWKPFVGLQYERKGMGIALVDLTESPEMERIASEWRRIREDDEDPGHPSENGERQD
jgi:hypothetical protein